LEILSNFGTQKIEKKKKEKRETPWKTRFDSF
jgi:hypothetical protein